MRQRIAAVMGVLWLSSWAAIQGQSVKIEGRVVDPDGKPAASASVSSFWMINEEDGKQAPTQAATTDADGRFTLKLETYGQERALMALDAGRKQGGLAVVGPQGSKEPVEIRLAPAVRVHGKFESKELNGPPPWTNVYFNLAPNALVKLKAETDGKDSILVKARLAVTSRPIRVAGNSSRKAEFSMVLPAAEYELNGYGSDVRGVKRTIVLKSDQPDLDLGAIELPATVIAKHKGKELPPWSLADARGVKKDVTLADYHGKWVLVDFWGYWCGPCVRQLAEMIDFYEEHEADRDKFEFLAFHDGTVKDFSEMDEKLVGTKRSIWRGRDLPFPVLLDAQNGERGATVKAYEIQSFPTSLLFDPEGKLVGEVSLQTLEEKLPPVPMSRRIPKALDAFVAFGVESTPLDKMIGFLSQFGRIPIKLDPEALKSAGVEPSANVPLKLVGGLSLRSWLELVLDPFGLEARPGPEGLLVVKATMPFDQREPSKVQKDCAARIEEKLAQKTSFDFKNATLEEVAQYFEGKTEENFILDPVARKLNQIDPETVVTGSADKVPLGKALTGILKPLGLKWVVRDELVLFTK